MPKNNPSKYRRALRRLGAVCLLVVLAAAGWWGYQWQAHQKVERIEITGAHHAGRAALIELAQVDTSMCLYDLDPALLEDRLRRHPWVRSVEVTRLPTGTLAIHVEERTPVVLVLNEDGTPSHYLDTHGFQIPLSNGDSIGGAYDVPLLRGQTQPYHPVHRIESEYTRALLAALAARSSALVSSVVKSPDGGWHLYTTPTATHSTIEVRLGRKHFAQRLHKLAAFWQQAVRLQPKATFKFIDVRFEGQVVTREQDPEERS